MAIDTTRAFDAPRGIQTPVISPVHDSSTGICITNADGSTTIATVDSIHNSIVIPTITLSGSTPSQILATDGTSNIVASGKSFNDSGVTTADIWSADKVSSYTASNTSKITFTATQSLHGFSALTPIYFDTVSNIWAAAIANNEDTLSTHVVASVTDINTFVYCQVGRITVTGHGKSVGYWFTSDTSTGVTVSVTPLLSNPVFFVEDANTVHVLNYRPGVLFSTSQQVGVASTATDFVAYFNNLMATYGLGLYIASFDRAVEVTGFPDSQGFFGIFGVTVTAINYFGVIDQYTLTAESPWDSRTWVGRVNGGVFSGWTQITDSLGESIANNQRVNVLSGLCTYAIQVHINSHGAGSYKFGFDPNVSSGLPYAGGVGYCIISVECYDVLKDYYTINAAVSSDLRTWRNDCQAGAWATWTPLTDEFGRAVSSIATITSQHTYGIEIFGATASNLLYLNMIAIFGTGTWSANVNGKIFDGVNTYDVVSAHHSVGEGTIGINKFNVDGTADVLTIASGDSTGFTVSLTY